MIAPWVVIGILVVAAFAIRVCAVNREMNRRAAMWDGNHLV